MRLLHGDCREVMRELPENSVDAIVGDPPYLLNFMGKDFDSQGGAHADPKQMQSWHESWAREAYRVLKPGGHLLAFGGDRTVHRLACAIEDSGFEIRGKLAWIHGQGFPKNLNVSDALRKRIPLDSQCACAQHSTRTVLDSLFDYPGHHHSGDAQPRPASMVAQGVAPSEDGALAHIHDDQPVSAPASGRASTSLDADSGRPSNGHSQDQTALPSVGFQSSGSTPSDTALNTSPDAQTEPRRTALGISDMSHSDGDSVASSQTLPDSGYSNLPHCTTCGKIVIPQGLGTALKPAHEDIVVARKPLIGTVVNNWLEHGTGALNIDGCRIDGEPWKAHDATGLAAEKFFTRGEAAVIHKEPHTLGRWPANVILDEDAAALLDAQSGATSTTGRRSARSQERDVPGTAWGNTNHKSVEYPNDSGGPSRFFYTAKASRAERNAGLDGMPEKPSGVMQDDAYQWRVTDTRPGRVPHEAPRAVAANHHPTVKPIALMRWLVRLITPPGGTVLDPFMGSGTTGIAAALEGLAFIGVEQDRDYLTIAERRIAHAEKHGENWLKAGKSASAPRQSGVYANGKGRRAVPRCPEHDGTLPSGWNTYTCGCKLSYRDYTDAADKTPALDYGPLFAMVAD